MRILVTGRQGQLVRSLLEQARERNHFALVALGRPELDLEIPATIRPAMRQAAPDVVINAAAYTAVDRAEDEPERAFRINAEAAGELAAAAREAGAGFIQISTDYVFDGSADNPYTEQAATSPLGVYGRTKLAGEERVREAHPEAAIVRTAWVYSPFGHNFVKSMIGLAEDRPVIRVVADQRGSPTSALDLGDGLLAMLDRWRQGRTTGTGQIYHLAGSGNASWCRLAEAVFEECGSLGLPTAEVQPITTADWPTRARRPENSVLDGSKFAADFNFDMPEWRDALRKVVRRIAEARHAC